MRSLIRLYCDIPLEMGSVISLSPEQGHYVRSVMRQKEGDGLEIFNGRDGSVKGIIKTLSKRQALIELVEVLRESEILPPVRLFFAPLKRSPMEFIFQKATELGATVLQPIITKRTTAKSINFPRLEAITIEAAEQCERLTVPTVGDSMALTDLLKVVDYPIYFADEGGALDQEEGGTQGKATSFLEVLQSKKMPLSVKGEGILIGPEGGFSPEERTILQAHPLIVPIGLGPHILRADTAAISALTLLQAYRSWS